jgi:hypothetical protein
MILNSDQLINEYGLNIHGESILQDVFNFIYLKKLRK